MSGGWAFLFPGQASQKVGMARDLCEAWPEARALFERADEALGISLSSICFDGPEEELNQTAITQPAVFVHSVAACQKLLAGGIAPQCVAGHSLGEYAALVAAGVFDFDTGLDLVVRRGRLMQDAGRQTPGAMGAVLGLDDKKVEELCSAAAAEGVVVAANFNAPGQVVVSGEAAAVDRLGVLAEDAGASRFVRLGVSGAFHSPLMGPAAAEMEKLIAAVDFAAPRCPVITNVGAAPVEDVDLLRQHLIDQMTHSVRWTETFGQLAAMGFERALEVGPGAVLKGLGRRIERRVAVSAAGTVAAIDKAVAAHSEGD